MPKKRESSEELVCRLLSEAVRRRKVRFAFCPELEEFEAFLRESPGLLANEWKPKTLKEALQGPPVPHAVLTLVAGFMGGWERGILSYRALCTAQESLAGSNPHGRRKSQQRQAFAAWIERDAPNATWKAAKRLLKDPRGNSLKQRFEDSGLKITGYTKDDLLYLERTNDTRADKSSVLSFSKPTTKSWNALGKAFEAAMKARATNPETRGVFRRKGPIPSSREP